MSKGIEFDNTAAMEVLGYEQVWPVGRNWHGEAAVRAAREWWIDLLETVTDGVSEVDWHEVQYQQERQESIARDAAANAVGKARKERRVLSLCDLSELDKVLTNPREGGVYGRLSRFIDKNAGITVHQRSGETHEMYEERRARAESEYEDESVNMLRLGDLAETYLVSAAEAVAERWAADQFEAWQTANPEDEDDEE